MKEYVFRYGENNRGLGILTIPASVRGGEPIVVFLNAGLLYRAEPYRLNVLVCRRLAEIGYVCLRVDISGKGDTPSRENLANRDSVSLDWRFIKKELENQFGQRNLIIFGLCSGADNGIKIAAQDADVKGLVLLDPVSKKDPAFGRRDFFKKVTNIHKWKNLPNTLLGKIKKIINAAQISSDNPISLRDEPTDYDMEQCFKGLVFRDGRILSVFTSHALKAYNKKGQFCQGMAIPTLEKICEEVFWPNADHLYAVQTHRDQLVDKVSEWCNSNLSHFRALK